jgi:hypothetical protein
VALYPKRFFLVGPARRIAINREMLCNICNNPVALFSCNFITSLFIFLYIFIAVLHSETWLSETGCTNGSFVIRLLLSDHSALDFASTDRSCNSAFTDSCQEA